MVDARVFSWWAGEAETGPDGRPCHPERYQINEPSRDAIYQAARREFGDAAWISIVEATQDGPFETAIFDPEGDLMERVIDAFGEANSCRFGEDGMEDFPLYAVAEALAAAFKAVITAHQASIPVFAFTEVRFTEILCPVGVGAPHSAHAAPAPLNCRHGDWRGRVLSPEHDADATPPGGMGAMNSRHFKPHN